MSQVLYYASLSSPVVGGLYSHSFPTLLRNLLRIMKRVRGAFRPAPSFCCRRSLSFSGEGRNRVGICSTTESRSWLEPATPKRWLCISPSIQKKHDNNKSASVDEWRRSLHRSNLCGQLSDADENKQVNLCGWLSAVRDIGDYMFLVINDHTGSVQIVLDKDLREQNLSEVIILALNCTQL